MQEDMRDFKVADENAQREFNETISKILERLGRI